MKKEKKLIKSASDMNLTSLKDTKKPKKKWKKATTPKSGFKRNLTSKLTNLMEKSLNHDIEDPETKNTSISVTIFYLIYLYSLMTALLTTLKCFISRYSSL